jgi:hypothetical protein
MINEGSRTFPQSSEACRIIPKNFRSGAKYEEDFCSSMENHALKVREVLRIFEIAGVARAEAAIFPGSFSCNSKSCQMDQALVNRLFDRGGAPGNVKLLKQTLDVGLHRPFGDPKFVPDGFVAVAFRDES